MTDLRFAVIGAGFWAPFQIAGWQEVRGAKCVAICDLTAGKAEKVAQAFNIPGAYDDAEALFNQEQIDFVDVITDVESHSRLVQMAAKRKLPVITQKPMADTLAEAEHMLQVCRKEGVPLYVHENWRWQAQIRELKRILDSGEIGIPFRARIFLVSGYPVFSTEPYLKDVDEYVIKDIGIHLLDVARFLFGEADRLYCQTHRVQQEIKGEDVATVMLHMAAGATVTCYMGYPGNFLENDVFTQTLIFVEGEKGSVQLDRDYWIRVTTKLGTSAKRYPPVWRPWMHPDYVASHASIAACNANILRALRDEGEAETTGEDNLKTTRLTFAAYQSARTGNIVRFNEGELAPDSAVASSVSGIDHRTIEKSSQVR